jgi:4-amino-4-deoxy-L-arabinose transferase-like glycosyltransferase
MLPTRRRATFTGYPAVLLLLLAFAATRWANLTELPLFIDEATGISRARDSLIGFPFQGLAHAKWLGTFIWALFRPFGPETLWLVRAVTGLLALLTCASAIGLGRLLGSKRAGLLAGLLVLLLPYAVFFDRQALADPLLMAFGAVMMVAALRLARRPHPVTAVVTGFALAAAVLSKFTGAVLLPVPLLTAWLMAAPGARKKALPGALLSTLLAVAVVLGVLTVADPFLPGSQLVFDPSYDWSWLTRHSEVGIDPGTAPLRWLDVARKLGDALPYFLGWPLLALGLASLAGLARRDRRAVLWLWLAGVLPVTPLLLVVTWLPARYLSFAVTPLVVLAALTALRLAGWQLPAPLPRLLSTLAVALLVVWPLPRSTALLLDPAGAGIPSFERQGYYSPPYSAAGLAEAGEALHAYAQTHGLPVHVVYRAVRNLYLSVYWGGHAGTLRKWEDSADQQAEVARWLLAGEPVVYLDGENLIPDEPHGNHTQLIGIYQGGGKTYRLRAVTEPGPDMLRAMYDQAFGNPYGVEADYRALADQLIPGQTLVLYPPHQAGVLSEMLAGKNVKLIPVGEGWPLDAQAAAHTLQTAAGTSPLLTAVFFNETGGDPTREVETWLNRNLFRLSERWYGALRVVDYITLPGAGPWNLFGVTFGDRITLEAAQVGGLKIGSARVVTIHLALLAKTEIAQSYKVAVHVVDESGQVVAQHDGIPLGYLAPTTTWQPGELVGDRFAILLPPGLPPGLYRLRLVLYDEITLERLPVTNFEGMGDSAIIGAITIVP